MSPRREEFRFSAERLARVSRMERWHFWFAGRQALLGRLLKKHLAGGERLILDIGCGTGFTAETLSRQGHRVVALDRRPEGLSAAGSAASRARFLRAEATRLPLGSGRFDCVVLLDVLEHADDRLLLSEVERVLCPGGLAVVTAPAMPWLWSGRDEAAGHLRRYTRRGLSSIIGDAGLEVREIAYYQCLLFPLVAAARLLGRANPRVQDVEEAPLPVLNSAMAWINRAEVGLGERVSWPWGSSLAAACRKP